MFICLLLLSGIWTSIEPERCCDQLPPEFPPLRPEGALPLHQWVCPCCLQGLCALLSLCLGNGGLEKFHEQFALWPQAHSEGDPYLEIWCVMFFWCNFQVVCILRRGMNCQMTQYICLHNRNDMTLYFALYGYALCSNSLLAKRRVCVCMSIWMWVSLVYRNIARNIALLIWLGGNAGVGIYIVWLGWGFQIPSSSWSTL